MTLRQSSQNSSELLKCNWISTKQWQQNQKRRLYCFILLTQERKEMKVVFPIKARAMLKTFGFPGVT